eukprot:m.140176 g.140176  ORF g.140176 m.140176 type:complete len:960 (+) comp38296_c0_seq1:140-3019(+)
MSVARPIISPSLPGSTGSFPLALAILFFFLTNVSLAGASTAFTTALPTVVPTASPTGVSSGDGATPAFNDSVDASSGSEVPLFSSLLSDSTPPTTATAGLLPSSVVSSSSPPLTPSSAIASAFSIMPLESPNSLATFSVTSRTSVSRPTAAIAATLPTFSASITTMRRPVTSTQMSSSYSTSSSSASTVFPVVSSESVVMTSTFVLSPTPTPLPTVIPYKYLVLLLNVSFENFNQSVFFAEVKGFWSDVPSTFKLIPNECNPNEAIVFIQGKLNTTNEFIKTFPSKWECTFKNSRQQITGFRIGPPALVTLYLADNFTAFDQNQFKEDLKNFPQNFTIEGNPRNASEARIYIHCNVNTTVAFMSHFQYLWNTNGFSNKTLSSILQYSFTSPKPILVLSPVPTTQVVTDTVTPTPTASFQLPSQYLVVRLTVPFSEFNHKLFEKELQNFFTQTFPKTFLITKDSEDENALVVYIGGDEKKNKEFINSFKSLWDNPTSRTNTFSGATLGKIKGYSIETKEKKTASLPGWAVGVIVAFCVLFISLIVVIVFIVDVRKKRKGKRRGRKEGWPSASNSFYCPPSERDSQANGRLQRRNISGIRLQVKSRLLDVAGLSAALELEDDLIEEFQNIPTHMAGEGDIPPDCQNKNRYNNVLPTPHSRVPLFLRFGDPCSDYINANFVRGVADNPKAYIATQGPMESTTNDFWRMVWEQNCGIILMATGLEEREVPKCARYWPDEQRTVETYGEIEVAIQKQVKKDDYTTTHLLIVHNEKQQSRVVIHHWFTAWPDFGVPEDVSQVINYLEDIREDLKEVKGPVIVHCSAGIGRSGCLLAIHMGMREMEKGGRCDILQTVSTIRHDRGGSVQTKDQYILIYMALYTYGTYLQSLMTMAKSDQVSFDKMKRLPAKVEAVQESEMNVIKESTDDVPVNKETSDPEKAELLRPIPAGRMGQKHPNSLTLDMS